MQPSIRWLSVGTGVRVAGYSMVLSFFFLYLRNSYGLAYDEIGLLVALTGVAPLAILPAAGLLTDRVGRRRVFLAALAGEAASLLLIALAMEARWLLGLLVFVTLLQTVGTIGAPAVQAYVADLTDGSERTVAYTWLRVGGNLGFTVGVISGGVLITAIGFVSLALAAGIVVVFSVVLLTLFVESSPYEKARFAKGAALVPGHPSAHRATVGESLRVLAQDRLFLAFCAAVAFAQLTAEQWIVIFPLYVNTVLGVPYALIGVGLGINGVMVAVGQAPMTRAALGSRHTVLMAVGAVLYLVGFLLLGLPLTLGLGIVAIFFLSVIVVTLGENLEAIPESTLPSNLAPKGEVGSYNGAFAAFSGIGTLLAPVVGGLVLAMVSAPIAVWGLLVLPTIPALLLLAYLTSRIDRKANLA